MRRSWAEISTPVMRVSGQIDGSNNLEGLRWAELSDISKTLLLKLRSFAWGVNLKSLSTIAALQHTLRGNTSLDAALAI